MLTDNYHNENIQSDNPGGNDEWNQSKLKRALDIFGCLFAINVCFVISCLPIFTIGAALAALYAMMFRIQKGDNYTVVREYFIEFRNNFKKGTISLLLIVLICVVIYAQYVYVCNFEGSIAVFYDVFIVIELVVFALVLPFIFPLLAYFDNSVLNTFKNAFLLAVSNLGAWIKMFIAWFATIAFSFGYEAIILNTWYLWLLLMFALIAYGTSLTARRVFDLVATSQQEKKEKDEEKQRKLEEEKKKPKPVKRSIKEKQALVAALNAKDTSEDETETSEKVMEEHQQDEKSSDSKENEQMTDEKNVDVVKDGKADLLEKNTSEGQKEKSSQGKKKDTSKKKKKQSKKK